MLIRLVVWLLIEAFNSTQRSYRDDPRYRFRGDGGSPPQSLPPDFHTGGSNAPPVRGIDPIPGLPVIRPHPPEDRPSGDGTVWIAIGIALIGVAVIIGIVGFLTYSPSP